MANGLTRFFVGEEILALPELATAIPKVSALARMQMEIPTRQPLHLLSWMLMMPFTLLLLLLHNTLPFIASIEPLRANATFFTAIESAARKSWAAFTAECAGHVHAHRIRRTFCPMAFVDVNAFIAAARTIAAHSRRCQLIATRALAVAVHAFAAAVAAACAQTCQLLLLFVCRIQFN